MSFSLIKFVFSYETTGQECAEEMIKLLSAQGLDFQQCNFEKYGPEEIAKLSSLLRKRGYQERQICKFLHITF